jgi:hypothetical protein
MAAMPSRWGGDRGGEAAAEQSDVGVDLEAATAAGASEQRVGEHRGAGRVAGIGAGEGDHDSRMHRRGGGALYQQDPQSVG